MNPSTDAGAGLGRLLGLGLALGSFANMGGQQHCFRRLARHVFRPFNSWSCSKQPDSKVCQPSVCFILQNDPLSSTHDYLMNNIMIMISKQLHAGCVC